MIKVGIAGAGTPLAGELIRILVNHPETDIISLYAPSYMGRNVSSVHHGLIGESIINFTDKINPEDLDIIFITEDNELSRQLILSRNNWPELKIIDLTHQLKEDEIEHSLAEIGLSEINRKQLVREAKIAYIPAPPLTVPMISLHPLAKYMLLNSPIFITLALPHAIHEEFGKPDFLSHTLAHYITQVQPSFNHELVMTLISSPSQERVMVMKTELKMNLSLDEIEKIYNDLYDDHNFTFVTHSPVSVQEVEGTQKCVIHIDKHNSDTLELTVFADARMRGGAGDAVHVMNLFKGLYEKTGLQLKSSAFDSSNQSPSSSWFA